MSKKLKLIICGASGFIGKNLTQYFSKLDKYDVHAIRYKSEKLELPNVTWHTVDLRNPHDVDQIMQHADIVIQAAATTSGAKDIVTKPYIHVTDNAVMNSYILRSAYEHKIKQVVFFSCTVMYQSSDLLIKEEDFNPSDELYPKYFGVANTKLYIEKMCEFFSQISNTKFSVIRHSNIYGPHDKFDLEKSHVFGATITKVMQAKDELTIWGTGKEKRDLLYIDDLISLVDAMIKSQDKPYCLVNCGSGSPIAIKDLVEKIILLANKNLGIKHDLSKPTIETSLALDCTLAKNLFNWQPKVDINTGIKKTLSWWQSNIAKITHNNCIKEISVEA